MILTFDPYTDLFVILEGPDRIPVRDFYIRERKISGKAISAVERQAGLNHPALSNVESKASKKPSNSLVAILAGIEALGYTIRLEK